MKNKDTNSMALTGFSSFRSNRKSRRFGGLTVMFAVAANVLLFSSINWVNRRAVELPEKPQTVIELFEPQPIRDEPKTQINSTNVVNRNEVKLDLESMQTAMLSKTVLKPRLSKWVPDTLLNQPGIKIDFMPAEQDVSDNVENADAEISAAVSGNAGPVDKAGFSGPLSINQVDDAPRKISGFSPKYPRWARYTRAEGYVILKFVVGVDGKVRNIEVKEIEGDERFAAAAKRAVRTWRFKPAMDEGKPVAVWGIQKIRFQFKGYR